VRDRLTNTERHVQ